MSTTTLREFLQEKARQVRPEDRDKRRKEWIESVRRLMAQFSEWLKEADTSGVLEILSSQVEYLEEGLGLYRVPKLRVVLGDSEVEILPVARNVGGPNSPALPSGGRVDITDGARKYILHRVVSNGEDQWNVLTVNRDYMVLDRNRFEAIMQELLS